MTISRGGAGDLSGVLDPRRLPPGGAWVDADGIFDALPHGGAISRRSRALYSRHPFDHAPSPAEAEAFVRGLSPLARRLPEVLPKGSRILEVGCGPGHATAWLSSHDLDVVAVDQSRESLRRLRARCTVPAVAADVEALPFLDGAFDAVVADGVVHHASSPRRALLEILRVLRPGGVLFLRIYRAEGLYPFLYRTVGGVLRALERTPPMDGLVWSLAFPAYRRAADARPRPRGQDPGRHDEGVFSDYFLTPRATPMRGSSLVATLRRRGLEVMAYEEYRNVHGVLARRRGGGPA